MIIQKIEQLHHILGALLIQLEVIGGPPFKLGRFRCAETRFQRIAHRGEILDIPIYGNIAAGMAQDVEQERQGCISIDITALGIPRNARTFALKVRGESMIDAHICNGDTVILEFREPRKGDIVAALIDGETTLKRYLVNHGKPFLRAENADYPDLLPARELIIQGVLVALLRHAA